MSTYFVDLLCACDYVKTITCTSISVDVSRTRSRLPSHDASKLPSGDHAHGPLSCVALENSIFLHSLAGIEKTKIIFERL